MNRRPNLRYLLMILLGILCMFIYCEYLIYIIVLNKCNWPELKTENEDPTIEHKNESSVRALVIADTHLLGSRNGHWLDKLRREWQMYRSFQTAVQLLQPEIVFILGDLTDEGSFCGPEEDERYIHRFYDLFSVPDGTRLHVVLGNHDIGFHYSISEDKNKKFVSAFKAPPVQLITLRGNHFVLLNSMALEGDGCFLCKPAEQELIRIEKMLKCSRKSHKGKCNPHFMLDGYSKPILMQHFPLYRPSDMDCSDFDAAPQYIKQEKFREGWECLSRGATHQILEQIRPRLALSGHTHHGCTRKLPFGSGVEITIPSFSWRNKDNPTIGLGVFTPNNYSFTKCSIPRESTVILLYMGGGIMMLIWLIYSVVRSRRRKRTTSL